MKNTLFITSAILLTILTAVCQKAPQSAIASDQSSASTGDMADYAAKKIPALLHDPKIVVSDKLKNQGFEATTKYPEKHKKLLSLADSKDWMGILELILGHKPSSMSDVESALRELHTEVYRFPVAIQSAKATFEDRYFKVAGTKATDKALRSISVITIADPSKPSVSSLGRIDLNVQFRSGPYGRLERHPSKNGLLDNLLFGDYTAYYFEDGAAFGSGHKVQRAISQLQTDLAGVRKRKELGELTPAQATTEAISTAKEFEKSIQAIVLQR